MNLLLIQLRRIGDVMMTTPAVRALRKAFPEASISFLTESPSDQEVDTPEEFKVIETYFKKAIIEWEGDF